MLQHGEKATCQRSGARGAEFRGLMRSATKERGRVRPAVLQSKVYFALASEREALMPRSGLSAGYTQQYTEGSWKGAASSLIPIVRAVSYTHLTLPTILRV